MIDETIDSVRGFLNTLDVIEKEWEKIYEKIGLSDQEISDLLHEIELTEFNDVEGNNLAEEIKKVRKHRRSLKDYQEVIRHLKEFTDRNKSLKISLFKVVNGMERTKDYQSNRMYTPRVRTDLKLCSKEGQKNYADSSNNSDLDEAITSSYAEECDLKSSSDEIDRTFDSEEDLTEELAT